MTKLGGPNASLSLICSELLLSSQQLSFLYQHDSESYSNRQNSKGGAYHDAGTAYHSAHQLLPLHQNIRRVLTTDEEQRLFGVRRAAPAKGQRESSVGARQLLELDQEDESKFQNLLRRLERREPEKFLESLVTCRKKKQNVWHSRFPLPVVKDVSHLHTSFYEELKKSWESHRSRDNWEVTTNAQAELAQALPQIEAVTARDRLDLEQFLLDTLNTTLHTGFRLLKTANYAARVTPVDLLRMACTPGLLHDFNPCISDKVSTFCQQVTLEWLQLCTLEDKLSRLKRLCKVDTGSLMNHGSSDQPTAVPEARRGASAAGSASGDSGESYVPASTQDAVAAALEEDRSAVRRKNRMLHLEKTGRRKDRMHEAPSIRHTNPSTETVIHELHKLILREGGEEGILYRQMPSAQVISLLYRQMPSAKAMVRGNIKQLCAEPVVD
eukprot:SAG22_NODE_79_length_21845_cov_17.798538_11_plen_440_part_00